MLNDTYLNFLSKKFLKLASVLHDSLVTSVQNHVTIVSY